MPKFLVPVTRDCTETTLVDVEAPNAEAALAAALGEAEQQPHAFNWTHDDGSGGQAEPYFAGGDDLEAIEQVEPHRIGLRLTIDCGQCDGTGTTDAMGYEEECPVCDGSGQIANEDLD